MAPDSPEARWDQVRAAIDLPALLAAIRANVAAHPGPNEQRIAALEGENALLRRRLKELDDGAA